MRNSRALKRCFSKQPLPVFLALVAPARDVAHFLRDDDKNHQPLVASHLVSCFANPDPTAASIAIHRIIHHPLHNIMF